MEEQVGQVSPYAILFWGAFMIWMLVDAWKRRAPLHWYVIIVVMMPIGAVVYFVMMKLRDYRATTSTDIPDVGRPTSVAVAPPNLDLADALEDDERYAEAEPLFRSVLAAEPDNRRALHGLGRCLVGNGNPKESMSYYEQLMELDRGFANYGAALDYADALWAAEQQLDAIELLERLVEVTGRINHRLALGHYLAEFGRLAQAKQVIQTALEAATRPDTPYNPRHQIWVARGQQMLSELQERYPESPIDSE